MKSLLDPRGRFHVEHVRDGKVIGTYDFPNGIVNAGKNKILDVMFNDGAAIANNSWFLGLIDNAGYTALVDADTAGSHAGWAEFSSYSEGTRGAWGSGASSNQSVTNASPVTFNINGSGTVKGVFVVSVSTKGGTTGTLWATALFSGDVAVVSGDQLKVTYTVSC